MAQEISEIAAAARLEQFFAGIGTHLKDKRKRESFALYAFGILGDGERKSAEPIAARACADPAQANNLHSKLCYFLGCSQWDDRAVRLDAARHAIDAVQSGSPSRPGSSTIRAFSSRESIRSGCSGSTRAQRARSPTGRSA